MNVNETPPYPRDAAETGCCPRFVPAPWDDQELVFRDKPFVRASTISVFHVPLNMGGVFGRTMAAIERAHAEGGGYFVLSKDDSPWHAEHLFAVDHDVPGADMVRLSGTFFTHVYEGSFSDVPSWVADLRSRVAARGRTLEDLWLFYTTCPKCAKVYGKNYVVGFAKLAAPALP